MIKIEPTLDDAALAVLLVIWCKGVAWLLRHRKSKQTVALMPDRASAGGEKMDIQAIIIQALDNAIQAVANELLEKARRMEPQIGDIPTGTITPTGPVIDSTITPVDVTQQALPARQHDPC